MSVWIFRGLFFVCLLFFKTKIWFFSYVIESSDLCACSIFFFSGPVVRLLCSHKLRPSKRPQCLEKLSDFQSLWFTSFITFEKILQILRMKETLFAVLISRVFFFFFSLAEQSKKDSEITELLETTSSARFCFSTPSFEVLFASCFSGADWTFSGNRQNLFRKPPEQLATFYAFKYLHIKEVCYSLLHISFFKEGVSFGILRIWNYIVFFI